MEHCLKCGREIEDGSVFCGDCLSVMGQYPVKKDTPIQLPKRDVEEAAKKASRRRTIPPEEQISRLRLLISRQRLVLLILVTALCIVGWLYISQQQKAEDKTVPIGQNYTVDTTGSVTGNVSRETEPPLSQTNDN